MSKQTAAKKISFVLVTAAIVAGLALYGVSNSPTRGDNSTIVQSVADGDTISVLANGNKEKVRLVGVDTPETVDPNRPVGCYGKEASAFTKKALPKGTKVRLELDAESRDRFGRLLAYVYRESDNVFVNAELARQGYAQPLTIPPNVAHSEEFVRLAAEARDAKRGLWAQCPNP